MKSGKSISFKIKDRRKGDTAYSCADVNKINNVMGWSAKRSS